MTKLVKLCIFSVFSCSVMCNTLRPHGLQPSRHFSPEDSPGNNTGVGCHFLLQGTFTQGLNPHLDMLFN